MEQKHCGDLYFCLLPMYTKSGRTRKVEIFHLVNMAKNDIIAAM